VRVKLQNNQTITCWETLIKERERVTDIRKIFPQKSLDLFLLGCTYYQNTKTANCPWEENSSLHNLCEPGLRYTFIILQKECSSRINMPSRQKKSINCPESWSEFSLLSSRELKTEQEAY